MENADVMVVVPADDHGVTLVGVVDPWYNVARCDYEIDLSAVDEIVVLGNPLPIGVLQFYRSSMDGRVEDWAGTGSWMVFLFYRNTLTEEVSGAILMLDEDRRLLPGDHEGMRHRPIDEQIEAFRRVRLRFGMDVVDALAAYGRAARLCRDGVDVWPIEPEGARIALAVRRATGAWLPPPNREPEAGEVFRCDLRCSVRGEDDPCGDW